jgi:abhydrolase domain-containing protein 6
MPPLRINTIAWEKSSARHFQSEKTKNEPGPEMKTTAFVLSTMVLSSGCAKVEQKVFDWGLSLERRRSGLKYRTIRVDGQTIAYLERPAPGDTIVMLHGFSANKDAWLRFVRYVPQTYRILAVDMFGHGDSSRNPDRLYDAQYLADGFSGTVRSLGLHRFHLAGNSLGGYVASFYAADNPQKIITLGLFAPAGVWSPKASDFFKALEQGQNPILVNSKKSFDRMLKLLFYRKPFMPWPARPVLVRNRIAQSEFEKKMWNDLWENRKEAVQFLPRIQIPVFLTWGDKDRILDVSGAEVFQRYLPDVKTVIVGDCGHGFLFEKPKEIANAYMNFIRSAESGHRLQVESQQIQET